MLRRRWFASLSCAVLLASGCAVDVDDDENGDDVTCVEECEEAHGSCSLDCDEDDNACNLNCSGERDDCMNDCD